MDKQRPVVVYGANGFSGRLVVEYLREYNVPFIAAGRNRSKIEDVISRVPGIETADYEIAETAGSVDELTKLFTGAKVVCNTVGPFIYNGPRVIEAALRAGCHYLDIGGEQTWARQVAENWGAKFAAKGLLAAPGTAFMSAVSDAAARLCVDSAAIDTLETLTMFKGIPTFGSTQTIFAVIQTDGYYLEQNQYKPWPRATRYDVVVPGSIQLAQAAGNTVRRPLREFRVVLRVGVGGRDKDDPARSGVPVEPCHRSHYAFRAGRIKGAGLADEIQLRIDVEIDGSRQTGARPPGSSACAPSARATRGCRLPATALRFPVGVARAKAGPRIRGRARAPVPARAAALPGGRPAAPAEAAPRRDRTLRSAPPRRAPRRGKSAWRLEWWSYRRCTWRCSA